MLKISVFLRLILAGVTLGLVLPGCGERKSANDRGSARNYDVSHGATPNNLDEASDSQSGKTIGDERKSEANIGSPKGVEVPIAEETQVPPNLEKPDVKNLLASGNWTLQRLVVLAAQGPIVMDLHCQIGNEDVTTTSRSMVRSVCEEVLHELGETDTWGLVLQNPLIRSGWLGSLITQDDQVPRIIQNFDRNRDAKVQLDELIEFVSQGGTRQGPFTFRVDTAASSDRYKSPWGPMDRDQNYLLDSEEVTTAAESLQSLDFDGNSNISLAEIGPISDSNSMMAEQKPQFMLPETTVIFESDRDRLLDQSKLKKNRRDLATQILQRYTYRETIQRGQWSSCSDRFWSSLDVSGDDHLDAKELTAIFAVEANCRLLLRLPQVDAKLSETPMADSNATFTQVVSANLPASKSVVNWYFDSTDFAQQAKWKDVGSAVSVQLPGLNLAVVLVDSFDQSSSSTLASQLDAGLRNAQVRAAIVSQLQLSERAFDLVDVNGDERLGNDELDRVLGWIRGRQLGRIQATWTTSQMPWFQILDQDMNLRISEWEISQVESMISELTTVSNRKIGIDSASETNLVDNSLPICATIQIRRGDERFAVTRNLLADSSYQNSVAYDWFSAMDSNDDGAISRSEFLGSRQKFMELDQDGSGFVSKAEVPQ